MKNLLIIIICFLASSSCSVGPSTQRSDTYCKVNLAVLNYEFLPIKVSSNGNPVIEFTTGNMDLATELSDIVQFDIKTPAKLSFYVDDEYIGKLNFKNCNKSSIILSSGRKPLMKIADENFYFD